MAQIRQGMATWVSTGAEQGRAYFLALLAETYGRGGQVAAGLDVVAEALAVVDSTGESWWEAELHRLQGELLQQQTAPDEAQAEACV